MSVGGCASTAELREGGIPIWSSAGSPGTAQPLLLQSCTTAVTSILAQRSPDLSMPLSLHAVTHPAAVQCLVLLQPLPHPPCALLGTVEDTGTHFSLWNLCSHPASCGVPCLWGDTSNPRLGDPFSPKAAPSQIQHPTFQQSTTKCACM